MVANESNPEYYGYCNVHHLKIAQPVITVSNLNATKPEPEHHSNSDVPNSDSESNNNNDHHQWPLMIRSGPESDSSSTVSSSSSSSSAYSALNLNPKTLETFQTVPDLEDDDGQNHHRSRQYARFKTRYRSNQNQLKLPPNNSDRYNTDPVRATLTERKQELQHDQQVPAAAEESGGLIEPSAVIRFLCYFSYFILIIFAYGRMFLEWINWGNYNNIVEHNRKGYRPLYNSWQAFFTRYIYRRVADIFSIPITGNPGGTVRVLDRRSNDHNFTFSLTGHHFECINLASYDYLGFSKSSSHDPDIVEAIRKYGVAVNPIHELGMLDLHQRLERDLARFLRVESCMVFGMGFATNSHNIPTLADQDCLILADERSHASAKSGIYLSRASFDYFKHNDCDDLERRIRQAIISGSHKPDHRPWKKIIIIVESVYSMEGTIVDLPRLIRLKNRYKCYLYVDEAHSIGAVGPNGRGIVDYFGCNPSDVDLLMGTMTKSFAAAGGYIAGSKQLIDHIRMNSMSNYAGHISAPIIQQIINTVGILSDPGKNNHEGERRISQLLFNTHYMRDSLKRLGFVITGHHDSPVIPIMIYLPAKIGSIVRMAVRNGLALVCAGYPATSLTTNRIRLCMTAGHSKETLDKAIRILSMIGDVHHIKYQYQGIF